ncbi:MAG TPA: prepilin-type N-terminal cleavage/methylation domain-containing protein [Sedimentisphaerales bacterium]|nr:prepilin-type N-terminal cleavage/methylation domain-containing protein [Sedimentisphaerales bacterium]
MNYKPRTHKGFTLIELMVAIGILAIVMSFASVIFRVSIDAYRTAMANSEIMQKLRAITGQLNADFEGLNKDAEIFVAWVAKSLPPGSSEHDLDLDGYERFDRIMFFASGDFQSYSVNPMVRGNMARICYMLAQKGNIKADVQKPNERALSRNQHIVTADPALPAFFDPNGFTNQQWYQWNNQYEYDKMSPEAWKTMSWQNKQDMLSVVTDIKVGTSAISDQVKGAMVDPADANSIHMLLCQGVGEFKIQSWYDAQKKWIPEVDPDGDGNLADTHFYMTDPNTVPGVLYPYPPYGGVIINNINYPRGQVDKARFEAIPGLGRALKFTFTLFDSKGIIKQGRTFTHIVYLGH